MGLKINKVYCFFEQSGTFKNEFRKLGIDAEDYDIQNDYGQTDHIMDLFAEIDNAYDGKPSVFDEITTDDLIMAFYPCIYFCDRSQLAFTFYYQNYKKKTDTEKIEEILKRSKQRNEFYERLLRFVSVVLDRKIKMIFENPWNGQHYLRNNFPKQPDIVDRDRALRGDKFHKPTAYWFWNITPKNCYTPSQKHETFIIDNTYDKRRKEAGVCSASRSEISSEYARNFIRDFIFGKPIGVGRCGGGAVQQGVLFEIQ